MRTAFKIGLIVLTIYGTIFVFGIANRTDEEAKDGIWNKAPVLFGPLIALIWIVFFTYEISSAPPATKYGGFYLLGYFITAYIIIGITFSVGYLTLAQMEKGKVLVVDGDNKYKPTTDFDDISYFSFVTASTLGYGDIIPKQSCRTLACVQVVVFILLLGIGLIYIQIGNSWRRLPSLEERWENEGH